jgi:excisionase family DNA binding protein
MSEFYTTHELAALLRVKERKVYDLVAKETLPFRRVTGKLLFPRDEISQWLRVNGVAGDAQVAPGPPRSSEAQRPLVAAGGTILSSNGLCGNRAPASLAFSTARLMGCSGRRRAIASRRVFIFLKGENGTSRRSRRGSRMSLGFLLSGPGARAG